MFLNYKNGRDVLPPELLAEVQKYLNGELIYIPKSGDSKVSWGALSGTKENVRNRNRNITEKYSNGTTIVELQEEYCLSEASIRKIIYTFNKNKSNG